MRISGQKSSEHHTHNRPRPPLSIATPSMLLFILTIMPLGVLSLIASAPISISVSGTVSTSLLRATSADIPSWKDLAAVTNCNGFELPVAEDGRSFASDPNLSDGTRPTLYRERHGWCPYSERVWLAMEAKGIDYDTIYIDNIYGRPR